MTGRLSAPWLHGCLGSRLDICQGGLSNFLRGNHNAACEYLIINKEWIETVTYCDLKNCAALVREANDRIDRLSRLRSMAERCTATMSETGVHAQGATNDKIGEWVARLDDAQEQCTKFYEMALENAMIIDMEICAVPDSKQRTVLRMRYIDGLMWDEISEKTYYSESWLHKLHQKGLNAMGLCEEDMYL